MSTGNPYLVLKDVGRMLVARLPDHLRHELRPVLAVGRMPDITPVFRWVIRPAAKHPHAAAIHNRRKPQPGRPAGALRHLLPRFAVGRRPHIVEGVILRNVIAAAKNVERVIEHNGLMVCPRRPAGSRRFLRPYLTVRRRPHIILEALVVAKVIILRPAKHPHPTLELNNCRSKPRAPASLASRLPLRAIGRRPHFIGGAVAGQAAVGPAAHKPHRIAKRERHSEVAIFPRRILFNTVPGLAVS